jgi:FKBP-type peptidyl-prolyl cis-trans isomerase FkpA
MRYSSFVLISILSISILSSCRQSKHKGFEKTEDGLYYQFFRKSDSGKKPKSKDILYTHMSLSLLRPGGEDSVLFDSKKYPDFPGDIKFIQLDTNSFKGDIMEGLEMMEVGDSAAFIINADSFFLKANRMDELPKGFKPGQELIFNIGLVEFQTEEETRARLSAYAAKGNAEEQKAAESAMQEEPALIAEYIGRKKIAEKPTATGMYFIPTLPGNGAKPRKGQKVSVHYTGYLLNGKKFDSSFDRNEPFTFTLGQGEVIAGWDEGISLMKVGGSATFVIPSQLAYGSNGSGSIPPFSPLVFDVQLIKIE